MFRAFEPFDRFEAFAVPPVGYTPSLALEFARNHALDSQVNFSRTSEGTYFDADGVLQTADPGDARFDCDPITGESLGLLCEETRTNLLQWNTDLTNAVWTTIAIGTGVEPVLTPNYALAPDGSMSAARLVCDRGSGNTLSDLSSWRQVVPGLANPHDATVSVWVKSNTGVNQEIYFRNTSAPAQKTVTTEWTLITNTFEGQTNTQDIWQIGSRGTVNANNIVDILIWRPQFELAKFASSTIATEGEPVTREIDYPRITLSTNPDWYNPDEGTFIVKYRRPDLDGSGAYITVMRSDTHSYYIRSTSGSSNSGLDTDGTEYMYQSIDVVRDENFQVHALAYKTNDSVIAVNGELSSVDTSVVLEAKDVLEIGNLYGTDSMNGHIAYVRYYPRRLPNAVLQRLTRREFVFDLEGLNQTNEFLSAP